MRLVLMIEGQEDVSWDQWLALAQVCEESGFDGLFRSDHYGSAFSVEGRGSRDALTTLTGLALRTTRIRLGTMVSPATFRHPSVLAKAVTTIDHISGGRVELGLGAGWNEREHAGYGFRFPSLGERMDLLEEQLEIVHRQWTEEEFSFEGSHYKLERCRAEPKPLQRPHPPLIMGGAAGPRSLALAARFADEYNVGYLTPDECAAPRERITAACRAAGREPIAQSLMTGCIVGRDAGEVAERLARADAVGADTPLHDSVVFGPGRVVGTVEQTIERLEAYEAVGIERVYLQHLVHDDLEMVRLIGSEIVPAMSR